MNRRYANGFSIIEVTISLAILGTLAAFWFTEYSAWMQNRSIRATGDVINNSLRIARTEAIKRGRAVAYVLSGSAGPQATVCVWDATLPTPACGATISTDKAGSTRPIQLTSGATVAGAVTGTPAAIVYDSFGRVTAGPAVIVIDPTGGTARRLVVVISPSGSTRLCDPTAASSAAFSCPSGT